MWERTAESAIIPAEKESIRARKTLAIKIDGYTYRLMSFWHGEKQKTKLGTKDVATVISLPIFCRWSTVEGKNTAEQFVFVL